MHYKQALVLADATLGAFAASMPARAQSSLAINGMLDLGVFRDFDGASKVGTI